MSAPEELIELHRRLGYPNPVSSANSAWADIEQGIVTDEELEDAAAILADVLKEADDHE